MQFFRNQYRIFLLLFFVAISVYHKWISFDIFTYGDWEFYFKQNLIDIIKPSVWITDQGIGSENLLLWKSPFNFIYGIFGYFGMASNVAEKFLIFWPITFFLPIASFILIKSIVNETLSAIIGSFIFSYNSYFLSINTAGHQFLTIASGFAIFSVYFFRRALRERSIYLSLIATLFLCISGFYDFRMAYIFLFFFFLYTIFFSLGEAGFKKLFLSIQSPIYLFLSLFLLFILLNLFWIIPFSKINILNDNIAVDRGLFGNNFFTLDKALYLSYPFWNGHSVHWFVNQPIAWWLYVITVIAFVGLWYGRRNKEVLFFGGFTSIIGIFLSKQVSDPLGRVYIFLHDYFPGFNAFREASKFYVLIALGYAVMFSFFCVLVLKNKKLVKLRYFYIGLAIIISLLNTIPFITDSMGTMFSKRYIPNDYIIFNDFSQSQDYFRIVGAPGLSRWNERTIKHPVISISDATNFYWSKLLMNPMNLDNSKEKKYIVLFNQSFSNQLLDISAVKYAIVPLQDIANDDDFFKYYGKRDFFIEELNKLPYLRKIDIGTQDLVVYENENYRPHIYATQEKETIYKDIPFEKVDFQFKNPTEYTVSLKNVSAPVYINFSEKYHSDWKLRIGDFNWFDVLRDRNYFLSDANHFENDAKLNSFLVDPKVVCVDSSTLDSRLRGNDSKKSMDDQNGCVKNPDGSINLDLTLYFKPQSYFYLGLIVSGTTLLGCLGYLLYAFRVGRKAKRL